MWCINTASEYMHCDIALGPSLAINGFKVLPAKPKNLLKDQEKSQTSTPVVPIVEPKASKGNGQGKSTPVGQLKNLAGGTDQENAVGAFGKLSGNKGGSGVN